MSSLPMRVSLLLIDEGHFPQLWLSFITVRRGGKSVAGQPTLYHNFSDSAHASKVHHVF